VRGSRVETLLTQFGVSEPLAGFLAVLAIAPLAALAFKAYTPKDGGSRWANAPRDKLANNQYHHERDLFELHYVYNEGRFYRQNKLRWASVTLILSFCGLLIVFNFENDFWHWVAAYGVFVGLIATQRHVLYRYRQMVRFAEWRASQGEALVFLKRYAELNPAEFLQSRQRSE
jgi:hypothetical protein